MAKYEYISLREKSELKDLAAEWFHSKWNIPLAAYAESIGDCLAGRGAVPQWYLAVEGGAILGGAGVIENDFHDRKDLTPNVCAVHVETAHRGKGIAGALLEHICRDMAGLGIDTLYLITDHTSFYERYGWRFLCPVQGDGEEHMTRMYVHTMDGD